MLPSNSASEESTVRQTQYLTSGKLFTLLLNFEACFPFSSSQELIFFIRLYSLGLNAIWSPFLTKSTLWCHLAALWADNSEGTHLQWHVVLGRKRSRWSEQTRRVFIYIYVWLFNTNFFCINANWEQMHYWFSPLLLDFLHSALINTAAEFQKGNSDYGYLWVLLF